MDMKDIWSADLLGRRQDALYLIKFLEAQVSRRQRAGLPAAYVLNIDTQWGGGKTFFLERLHKELKSAGHLVTYVNAWKDDHAADPLIALMSEVDQSLGTVNNAVSRAKWRTAKAAGMEVVKAVLTGAARSATKRYLDAELSDLTGVISKPTAADISDGVSDGVDEAVSKLSSIADKAIEDYRNASASIEKFRDNLGLAIKASPDRKDAILFILLDELDRCRPTYALELLERAKHLFSADRVVFIAATDTRQLRHSVAGVYGEKFDSQRYLRRFFDQTYRFTEPDRDSFVRAWFEANAPRDIPSPCEPQLLFALHANARKASLRDIEQWLHHYANVLDGWTEHLAPEAVVLSQLIVEFHDDEHLDMAHRDLKYNFAIPYNQSKVRIQEFFNTIAANAKNLPELFSREMARDDGHDRRPESYTRNVLHSHWETTGGKKESVLLKLPAVVAMAGRMQL